MNTAAFSIRPTAGSDWRHIRELRLEMIRDTPTAYTETLDDALARDEAHWRMRGERGTADHGIAVVAIDDSGRWIGAMRGFADPTAGALLLGVYVTPDFRGREAGVTDALLSTIEAWARTEGDRLTLYVHEDNARAIASYERRGFTFSGHAIPYDLDPSKNELEMVKDFSRP